MASGFVIGFVLAPFIWGTYFIASMYNLTFIGGALLGLFIIGGPLLIHDFYLKRKSPDYIFLIENHPDTKKIALGIYFVISVILYGTLDFASADRVLRQSSVTRFCACMVLAVPILALISVMLGESIFFQKWIKRKADEIRPVPLTPPTPPKEWGPAAPVDRAADENVYQFDKDRFKRRD